ncbi:hypothetical protein H8A97_22550 [Bradyrhizobium sp. Arg62]|uniref:hypothetical protein n=1 Tax=Bradyrhizobium brasilense TaxID=1419277 RepID=UPI001E4CE67E|nr:hypothetical protein [Bradyrhizobium brasilense]MCC8947812.1 hypothetical protein [Bradyrhizobium brasilense]
MFATHSATACLLDGLGAGSACLAVFVAFSFAMTAFRGGADVIGALFVGIAAGALTLAAGETSLAVTGFVAQRAVILTAFAVPAAIADTNVVLALSQIGVPSLAWREAFLLGRVLRWLHDVGPLDRSDLRRLACPSRQDWWSNRLTHSHGAVREG